MPARRRPAAERRRDFDDACLPYTAAQARWEASRCLGCHEAPCRRGCHAAVDIRRFIRLIRHGDVLGAADIIRRANVLGGSTARVCDAARGCMARCVRADLDGPVDIAGLEWFAIETARQRGLRPLPVGPVSGRSVAVLGAGPAGLATAAELRRRGHGVVLYEERPVPGGALVWGLPPYRLPRALVQDEVQAILDAGVELRTSQCFESLDSLRQNFDGVVVATGLSLSAHLGVDGEDLGGVLPAASLLDGSIDDLGPHAVVVGGGHRAVDAATTALRLVGAKGRVTLIYRRGFQQLPISEGELLAAVEEGVVLRPLTAVERILGDAEGNVALVRCRTVGLGDPEASGRAEAAPIADATFDLPASSVVVAASDAADADLLASAGLPEDGPCCDERGRTDVKGVYVAGDLAAGRTGSVCWAVASGVRAAEALDEDLERDRGSEGPYPVLGPKVDISVEVAGKTLLSPFILSASPATDDLDMARAALRAGWAGVVLRTTTLEGVGVARKHPSIHVIGRGPTVAAALVATEHVSAHHVDVVEDRIGAIKEEFPDRLVAASIVADTREGWQKLARRLADAGADAIECDATCAQGTLGLKPSAPLGLDAKLVRTVTRWVRDAAPETPIFIKLTPLAPDLAEVARAVAEGGGTGVTAASTLPVLAGVDLERGEPLPSVGGKACYAGLAGPAVLPLALRAVAEAARASGLAVSGSGGVGSARDALAMLMVGASTVQVYSAIPVDGVDLIDALAGGLARFMERQGVSRVADLVGRALDRIVGREELAQAGAVRARVDQETCIGCGRCHVACRDGAHRAIDWEADERRPLVDLSRCVGCGLCAGLCPTDSIDLMVLGA